MNKVIRVAQVEDCLNGQRTDPFELDNYEDWEVGEFCQALNDTDDDQRIINIMNVFCWYIDKDKQEVLNQR